MKALFLLQLILFFHNISGFLDFEELNTVDYGIHLLDTPVVKTDAGDDNVSPPPLTSGDGPTTTTSNALYMTSIHGQQYQCAYTEIGAERKREKEDEQSAVETGISELLRPMQEGPCLIYNKGWWTYEFCYGKSVKQYHMDEQSISGNILTLGLYESEYDWNNATDKKKKSSLNRYHSQQYVNGTLCDLTGSPRKCEVRFMCEEGSGDHISRIDEPETCGYIITVQTTKICHHPFLKPPVKSKPVPITCHPVLSQQQYEKYQAAKEEEKLAKEAAVLKYKQAMAKEAEELKRAQDLLKQAEEDLKEMEDELEDEEEETGEEDTSPMSSLETHEGVNEATAKLEKLLSETLAETLQNVVADSDLAGKFNLDNMEMKVVEDPADLRAAINEMLRQNSKKAKTGDVEADDEEEEDGEEETQKTDVRKIVVEDTEDKKSAYYKAVDNAKREEDQDDKSDAGESTEQDELEDIDQEFIDDFNKEYNDIASTPEKKAHAAKYKDNIDSAMQAQFSDIVEEAEKELGMEGEADKGEAFAQLSQTLEKLLTQIQKNDDADSKEKSSHSKMSSKIHKVSSEQSKNLFPPINKDSKPSSKSDNKQTFPRTESKYSAKDLPSTHLKNFENNESPSTSKGRQVQLKVTKFKKSDSDSKDDNPKTKLEATLKDSLEKSSLETKGRKVEVRIVTAGYYNEEDGTVTMLGDDDQPNNLNNMVFAILGENDEEIREAQRQQQQESAYNFQFSADQSQAGNSGQKTGGGESGEKTVMESEGE